MVKKTDTEKEQRENPPKETSHKETSASNGKPSDLDAMVFDTDKLVEVDVTIGKRQFTLKEASGDAACRWRNSVISKTELGPDGKPKTVGAIADTEPLLVSMCLFPTGSEQHVSIQDVRSWPAKIQKALFERIKRISDLDETEETEEEVKND